MGIKVALHNLGCKVNAYEVEAMQQLLEEAGYEIVPFEPGADVYLINTCTVTNIADRKSRQMLHKAKKMNPDAIVVATGCYVQTDEGKLDKDEAVDLILGNNQKGNIVQVLQEYEQQHTKQKHVLNINQTKEYEELAINHTAEHVRAYIKVQDGCNQFCTYCIIPKLRGRYRSREMASLLEEARALSDAGVKELIVIAQDITKYGMDLPEHKRLLPELLRELCKMDFTWIRLHYLYPDQITDELIDVIADEPKIVKYLDIPLQHVSKRILRAMHRPGDGAEFTRLIEDMRERIPGLVLRTSLIVGLPGETEDEFAELCEFLQNVGIERVGVFEYSPEEGTEAAELPDQIDDETKQNRRLIVEELQSGVLDDYNTSRHGEVMQVLCEGFDEEQGLWYGRTYADSVEVDGHVYFDAADNEPAEGEFVSVLITESLGPDLLGVRQKEA